MLGNIKLLLNAICLVVVFTILLVAGNTMAMSIRERTAEVAVLKTLGFRRSVILYLLVGESVSIALLGGFLGALGAKTTYAYIHMTIDTGKSFGYFTRWAPPCWPGTEPGCFFAGTTQYRGWIKAGRIAVTAVGSLVGLALGWVSISAPASS